DVIAEEDRVVWNRRATMAPEDGDRFVGWENCARQITGRAVGDTELVGLAAIEGDVIRLPGHAAASGNGRRNGHRGVVGRGDKGELAPIETGHTAMRVAKALDDVFPAQRFHG